MSGHWSIQGRCLVLVHDDEGQTDDEFAEMLDAIVTRMPDATDGRAFIYAAGVGAPTAEQRRRLRELDVKPAKVAVLSDSSIVRGIVTAISWFYGAERVRSFSTTAPDDALAFLDIGDEEADAVLATLQEHVAAGGYRPLEASSRAAL